MCRLLCEAGAVKLAANNHALCVACQSGRFECVRVLSSFGMPRDDHEFMGSPEAIAEEFGHEELLAWLVKSRRWTLLHHIEELTVERARALLRGGASLRGRGGSGSPLKRARTVGGDVSALLLRAARWSVHSHDLFPAAARARAVELLKMGYLLASSHSATQGHATALVDVWRQYVLPHAITRP